MEGRAMRHIFRIVICLPILLAIALHAETVQQSKPVASKGETVIVAKSEKLSVRVKIVTHTVDIGTASDEIPKVIRSSCTYTRVPCSIVDGIDIAVNGKPLFVPRSTFCDISDLNTAEVMIEQNKSILTLTGGDTSGSYIVKIEFDKDRIKRRSLSDPEWPNKPAQVTTYYRL
jgi:hypothetical protein